LRQFLTPDPGDDYLVNLARAADVDFLVSCDSHLTELNATLTSVCALPRLFLIKILEEAGPR
jgi:predicted nucleic acid-binding protein